MRRIERTNQFKRDYKRESRGRHRTDLDASLARTVEALVKPLKPRLRHLAQRGEVVPRPRGHGAPAPLDARQPYGHLTDRHEPAAFLLHAFVLHPS